MCAKCISEATAIANEKAAASSDALKGHGRAVHGRDAGHKAKMSEASRGRDQATAWQQMYSQTLNRLQKLPHPR